jgi:hypothetical protein
MGERPVCFAGLGFVIVRFIRVSYHIRFSKEKNTKELAFRFMYDVRFIIRFSKEKDTNELAFRFMRTVRFI